MANKTDALAGCDPTQGKDCNCLRLRSNTNNNHCHMQALAGIVLASLAPALRSYLENYGVLIANKANGPDYIPGLVLEFATALLAEAERHEEGAP